MPETPHLTHDSNRLLATVRGQRYALVVADTLAAATAGMNENAGEDMTAALDVCRQLHGETGAMMMRVHHSGKDGTKGIMRASRATTPTA